MTVRRPLVLVDGQFRQLPAGDTLEAAQGFFRTVAIAATAAGQTMYTVPGGYTPGAIFVSLNGSALAPADFTAADGASVVLESGAGIVVGSVLLVYVLSAFEVANALPLGGTAADASRFGGQLPAYYATQEDLAGVTPGPEFYQRSNILGMVSQLNGVPTGALVEYGSNSNGEYWRYAGGMQICRVSGKSLTFGNVSNLSSIWVFPAGFVAAPQVVPQLDLTNYASKIYSTPKEVYQRNATVAQVSLGLASASQWVSGDESLVTIGAIALGRWSN